MNLLNKFLHLRNCRNMVNKCKKDNKGSSFVLVLVSIALIMILVAVVFVMIFIQYRMLSLGRQSKNNFYYLEEVLDEMRAGVGNESIKQLKSAYDETVSMVVYYDTNQQKYMSVSAETAENIMDNKFLNNIQKVYGLDKNSLSKLLLSYVQNVNTSTMTTTDNVKIAFGSDFKCYELQSSNPKKTVGYSIKDITVSRIDDKGNEQSITTDISIYPPEEALNFLASGSDLENVFTYAMVADYGLEISGGATTDVRITGNVYAANDTRNNGIYKGSIDSNAHKINGSKTGGDGSTDASLYSGIFVTGAGTSLNLQSDILAINGSIAADDGATINANTKSDESSRTAMANLWANNIATTGDEGSNIYLKAQCSLSDDLELNGKKSKVVLDGLYYGYNYAAEEEYQNNGTTNNVKSQISAATGKSHTNSSAIIINGEKSSLDLSKLTEMVINGRSYIDLVSEKPASAEGDSSYTDYDIKTAESISAKGTQLVYRVLESRDIKAGLPSLTTTPTQQVGNVADKLTTGVPYYNMIQFLTYQFFEDEGYKIYTNKDGNDLYDADWAGIDKDSYEDVWKDIKKKGTSSQYYDEILEVYFPKDKVIVAKQDGNGAYIRNSSNQIEYTRVANSKITVMDCYNNKYDIYDNTGSIVTTTDSTKTSIVTGINRYGFLTVGTDYNQISLVKTVVGAEKDVYYYYQFYDEDAKAEFVTDYAKYSSESAAIDDVTSTETFNSEMIALPDSDEATVYTRGLSTVLESSTDSYELKPAEKKNSNYDEVELMKLYQSKVKKACVYKCYFPKSEANITTTQEDIASELYKTGIRNSSTSSLYTYTTKENSISPLTNPDCLAINWTEVSNKECANGGQGKELTGYTGARVWISTSDITIDGNSFSNKKTSGIVLCMGDVTIKNMREFTGTILAAGKVYVTGNTKFYADEQMCNGMLQNDKDNMIRTCLGLSEFKVDNDETDKAKSISSIEYTDLVGFEHWVKNGE